jgi:hypothetical protein
MAIAHDSLLRALPVSDPVPDRSCYVTEDAATGVLTIRLAGHVDKDTAVEAVGELADRLLDCGIPTVIVADVYDVESFDVDAPVAAVKVAAPAARLISHVEIIVKRQIVRLAAISAARLLGLSCTVRTQR